MFHVDKKDIVQTVKTIIDGERNYIANSANVASILSHSLENVNWCGFYFLRGKELVLGPFNGLPACIRIPIGKGVCGTSVAKKETLVVDDVHTFEGHIACDSASQSEIVIPLIKDGVVLGVLDIDSPIKSRFDKSTRDILEQVVELMLLGCDFENLPNK